jgi:hypothetical protein
LTACITNWANGKLARLAETVDAVFNITEENHDAANCDQDGRGHWKNAGEKCGQSAGYHKRHKDPIDHNWQFIFAHAFPVKVHQENVDEYEQDANVDIRVMKAFVEDCERDGVFRVGEDKSDYACQKYLIVVHIDIEDICDEA